MFVTNRLFSSILLLTLFLVTGAGEAQDPTQMSRRGFLRFLGQGAVTASLVSGPAGASIVSSIVSDFERIGIGEMLEAYRAELIDSGLLGSSIGPQDENAMTRIWSYRKLLAEALQNQELSAAERKLALKLLEELKVAFPSQVKLNPNSQNQTTQQKAEGGSTDESSPSSPSQPFMKRLIEIRQKLPPRLLVRMAWQQYFPNDLILSLSPRDKDFEKLDIYFYRLSVFLDAYDLELDTFEPETKQLALVWLEEAKGVLATPAVKEWLNQNPTCFALLN